ncbi:MAG TPA: L-threonylcarbamoyladenylate synthase [Acidimicrobiales bacterium]|jgi:tRNA threonylcarbamoyl adenosine modification protein (Sua5/YciO/YrdC/YwlC family)|nr:L-threonylcarbamoyladenylate synthase [Acidimicrobiales bacterium]HJL90421.1 L-threonylcarbamoyladenylate synthase [Acidimicrobiales bacterium]|tara:strand:- start:9374 stop:10024 length:651 start_codon:yes stop_codon:yes gene_type:complete
MTSNLIRIGDNPGAALSAAVTELRSGAVVVVPTDTVYGLAALVDDADAVAALFERKGRPAHKRVAVLVADVAQALRVVDPDPGFDRLVERFWPGPLTLVCRRASGFGAWLGDDLDTVAVRCPGHDLTRSLASEVGPLAATSANRSGGDNPVSAAAAGEAVGGGLLVLDGGECGTDASTVLDLVSEPARVLRQGAITATSMAAAGIVLDVEQGSDDR